MRRSFIAARPLERKVMHLEVKNEQRLHPYKRGVACV